MVLMSNKKPELCIRIQAGKIIHLALLLDIQLRKRHDNFNFCSCVLFLISSFFLFCSLNHNSERLKGKKLPKIGTQAPYMYRNIYKLIWVSLVLAWMVFSEVIECISHSQKRILNTANWENGILPFSQLQKTQGKSRAAVLSYEAKAWILVLSKSMIILLCQTVAVITGPRAMNLFAVLHNVCLFFNSVWTWWTVSKKWKNNEKLISPSSGEEQLALHGSLQKDSASPEKYRKIAANGVFWHVYQITKDNILKKILMLQFKEWLL